MKHLEQALTFRKVMGQPIATLDELVHELQFKLIEEEFGELWDEYHIEFDGGSLENQLKELADLVYVCYQYAVSRGWDLDTALDRVHDSNMSKLVDGKPLRREDGKILKGYQYQPPTLTDLV